MSGETVLANARLVLADEIVTGSLVLRDDRIVEVGQGRSVPVGATDCEGDLLSPGLVELHTDNLERHLSPRPAVAWPHDAAILAHDAELAGCGITTVFDALRVGALRDAEGVRETAYARGLATELQALWRAGALRISHHVHLRAEVCSHTLIEELESFGPDDRVGLLSLMDHTPGQRQFADVSKYRQYMMGKHAMDEAMFERFAARLVDLQAEVGAVHEAAAVAAAGRLGATLASHDDTTPEHVMASAGQGARVAEFPTTLAAAEACRAAGIAVMMGAPNIVRGGSHSGNVAAAELAQAGLLDILSSDYVPAALLTGAMMLAQLTGDLPGALATVTSAPARAVGLDDRGELAGGKRADLVRLRLVGDIARPVSVWSAGRRVA
ncbi:alpha-D-ribose 1-methylphosphonate 5-triphosphate diphosphatase [Pelagovum pacificum]|uniref:Alpha-D-ribose 1-methylphosphonate 5-triphosphate diphosphatase n=1 Tax=Pelagovum pacificum TaxID=2588711 RepID=A0A5C5GG82_9RHOB|nr:alpha-D-ribose 1-methylphosphonate 5-triphosphate diphosphatase [Pelagovum pacificum]QQA43859.1 alpha-D-ribose 1-methylphosphonate 5-triphosphate diphosphatase [Pelagovum pacificum]TNY33009.1 alpha-D-ribose 1-methylphosphonate 5-triphosphate diphosphatase [Pelagovum pacificum]